MPPNGEPVSLEPKLLGHAEVSRRVRPAQMANESLITIMKKV